MTMWIAPSRYGENWTSDHWAMLDLSTDAGWKTAVEIFEDRIQYRYLDAVQELKAADDAYYKKHSQRRFGFAVMALDCLLIETLAQFYEGLQSGNKSGMGSKQFYIQFLTERSFVLKNHFDAETPRLFYETIRCGVLHQTETANSTLVKYVKKENRSLALEETEDGNGLCVYWSRFHELVVGEYTAYCNGLRQNVEATYRENFIRKMKYICHTEEA